MTYTIINVILLKIFLLFYKNASRWRWKQRAGAMRLLGPSVHAQTLEDMETTDNTASNAV